MTTVALIGLRCPRWGFQLQSDAASFSLIDRPDGLLISDVGIEAFEKLIHKPTNELFAGSLRKDTRH